MPPRSKEKAVKQAYDKAHECELTHHGCSQCVILGVQDTLGLKDDNLFKAASGLCGGIGQMHDVCGALLGGALMLGTQYGRSRDEIEKSDKVVESMTPVGKLYKWFEKEYGGVRCRDVRVRTMGVYYDTKVPWQAELAQEAGMYKYCSDLAGKVAARVVDMLWEDVAKKK